MPLVLFLLISGIILVTTINTIQINWPGLVVVFAFYFFIFGVGIWSARKNPSPDSDSFLLTGRKLPLWIAMLTMSATWLGGGYINGTAEAAGAKGLLWVQAPWGYGFSLIIGGIFFARKMRRYQFRTMLDPLAQRFGTKATGIFFIPALFGEVFWSAAILTALGTTFSEIIGLDTQSSIILSATIAIVYTTLGGLWSVAYTDVIQLGFIILGLILVVPFLLDHVGGMERLWLTYQQKFDYAAMLVPDVERMGKQFWSWIDSGLLLIFGGIPWQVYFQRVLAAKNERTAMWLSIIAGVICMAVAIPAALVGMIGGIENWASLGLEGPENAASLLPYTFYHLTPETISVIGLAAIAAAVMSSVDSSMLSASSLATWNVYKPLIKPSMDTKDLKKSVQRAIVLIGVAATLLALRVESVYDLWYLCSDLVYCLLFPALVTALFDPKANRWGALSGFGIALILRVGGGEATFNIPAFVPFPMMEEGIVHFPFRSFAMIIGLITNVLVSRLTQRHAPAQALLKPE